MIIKSDEQIISEFKKKVEIESQYAKWFSDSIIQKLYDYFCIDIKKQSWPTTLENPLEISLEFYQRTFPDYYKLIIEYINDKKVIIDSNGSFSHVNSNSGLTYIKPKNNDGDLYMFIHEFAHLIDVASVPRVIDPQFWVFAETFAFKMERHFEASYFEKFKQLHQIRNINRLYYEREMLEKIMIMLKYEQYYKKNGTIDGIINIKEARVIVDSQSNNLINTFLGYPIGNLLSCYLVENSITTDTDLCSFLRQLDISKLLEDRNLESKVKRISF